MVEVNLEINKGNNGNMHLMASKFIHNSQIISYNRTLYYSRNKIVLKCFNMNKFLNRLTSQDLDL